MADTIVKRVGGKTKIAHWIKGLLPHHSIYVEPFGGSFAVGLAIRQESSKSKYRKVYNDLDGHISNFFQVLRDNPEELINQISLTPYGREEFLKAVAYIENPSQPWKNGDNIQWARNYLVYNRQSIFGKETGNWCISLHGENICMTWATLPALIQKTAASFKDAYIECLDYQEILKKWDSPHACFYLDPPYEGVEKDFYHINKKEGFDHISMKEAVAKLQGSWAISYYDSKIIRELYSDLDCVFHTRLVKKHMQTTGSKDSATEMLIVHENNLANGRSEQCFPI